MRYSVKIPLALFLWATPALIVGCGGKQASVADTTREHGVLAEIYEIYMSASKKNQKPPTQLSELKEFQAIYPNATQELRSGRFTVVWGTPIGKGNTALLAYEKDAPQKGGLVVLANGTVKQMSAADVQEATKAKG